MVIDNADWPVFGWITDVLPGLGRAREDNAKVVLGTLVRTQGPSPRPVGSQMIFRGSQAQGYFSGGCLEADVASHALDVAESGRPRLLHYGRGSPWIDIRLLCGGSLEIMLERIEPDDAAVAALLTMAARRQTVGWVSDGVSRQANRDDQERDASFDGHSYTVSFAPRWQLIVVGADPIALAIASLAATTGFLTTLVHSSGPMAAPPLAGVAYSRLTAVTAITALGTDGRTAVVSATHDDDRDDEAVLAAVAAGAGYVGVLGSGRRVTDRLERLAAAGLSAEACQAVRAPVGIGRCGKAPWEVAVSVIAEVMQTREMLARQERGVVGEQLLSRVGAVG
jgi:xanthine dehydrogenase accessory factor